MRNSRYSKHRLNENARREVLARPFLPSLAASPGVLVAALDVDAQTGPLGLVDQRDQLLEVDWILESRLRARIDGANMLAAYKRTQ